MFVKKFLALTLVLLYSFNFFRAAFLLLVLLSSWKVDSDTVRLTLNSINFKINAFLKISRFYSFAYKNIVNLIISRFSQINTCFSGLPALVLYLPGQFLLIPLQSMVRQFLSSRFAKSIKSLFIHIERTGTYFVVVGTQLLWSILETVLKGTLNGKILKIFVCEMIFFQISLLGIIMWKT